jgi:hypothetical protein
MEYKRSKVLVYDVGDIGAGRYRSRIGNVHTPSYVKWIEMLRRCYSERQLRKDPNYFDCYVCDEWLNYQNFAPWYDKNYPRDGENYHLDKDIKISGNKVYGPDTCLFVTPSENAIHAHAITCKLVSPDGDIVEVYNMSNFCRVNGLCQPSISKVRTGKRKHHKGWRLHG